jgi:hypothetical protein
MNTAWSTLVGALAGHEPSTPSSWPTSRMHRMLDDTSPHATREQRPAGMPVRAVRHRISTLRCTCAECADGGRPPQ